MTTIEQKVDQEFKKLIAEQAARATEKYLESIKEMELQLEKEKKELLKKNNQ